MGHLPQVVNANMCFKLEQTSQQKKNPYEYTSDTASHGDIHSPLLQMQDKHQEQQAASCTHTAPAPEQTVTNLVFVNTNASMKSKGYTGIQQLQREIMQLQ